AIVVRSRMYYVSAPSRVRRAQRIPEGTIKLVGGQTNFEGNVEIYHLGRWGSICDDEWDITDANVVCKSLGFRLGALMATNNGQFGRARKLIWMDNIYCNGNEQSLDRCQFDGWKLHDCTTNEAAGVICKTKLNDTNQDINIRLNGGRNKFEGRVEVKVGNSWKLICGDGWGLLEAMVVCRQLELGYAQYAVQSSVFGGHNLSIALSGVRCKGYEKNLADCNMNGLGSVVCPAREESIAGVLCTSELPDLVPDEKEIESSAYLEDRQLMFLQCAMEENCLASSAYNIRWIYEQRRLLRFTARIANVGTADFRPFLPKHIWDWHACHRHYHSMEVFAHFDILNSQGERVAEGHKASFCLEDNNCKEGVTPKYACANYGDQGISVGCVDTYLHSVDCQWIDITDLSPGFYQLKISINPEFKVSELNFDNNAALCTFYYNSIAARVWNCTLTRP
ncbi:unnamed protein product, partial [Sphagnum jensenii]